MWLHLIFGKLAFIVVSVVEDHKNSVVALEHFFQIEINASHDLWVLCDTTEGPNAPPLARQSTDGVLKVNDLYYFALDSLFTSLMVNAPQDFNEFVQRAVQSQRRALRFLILSALHNFSDGWSNLSACLLKEKYPARRTITIDIVFLLRTISSSDLPLYPIGALIWSHCNQLFQLKLANVMIVSLQVYSGMLKLFYEVLQAHSPTHCQLYHSVQAPLLIV